MKYKLSHNDYWCENPFYDAVRNECNIVEADIILKGNDIMLSHSWRPFKFMCYGKLSDYLKKIVTYNHLTGKKKRIILYIEFKTGNRDIMPILFAMLKPYREIIKVIVNGSDKYWFQKIFMKRELLASEFWFKYQQYMDLEKYDYFIGKHFVESVDLYKDSFWKF